MDFCDKEQKRNKNLINCEIKLSDSFPNLRNFKCSCSRQTTSGVHCFPFKKNPTHTQALLLEIL